MTLLPGPLLFRAVNWPMIDKLIRESEIKQCFSRQAHSAAIATQCDCWFYSAFNEKYAAERGIYVAHRTWSQSDILSMPLLSVVHETDSQGEGILQMSFTWLWFLPFLDSTDSTTAKGEHVTRTLNNWKSNSLEGWNDVHASENYNHDNHDKEEKTSLNRQTRSKTCMLSIYLQLDRWIDNVF